MALNGIDEEATNTERFIGALQSLRAVLREFSEEQRRHSGHLVLAGSAIERIEKAVGELSRSVLEIKHHIAEARDDIDEVKDQTDPKGFRLLDPTRYPLGGDGQRKEASKDSGSALAIKDGKVKVALPAAWAGELLKLGLSLGLGGGLMRFIQWLVNGH